MSDVLLPLLGVVLVMVCLVGFFGAIAVLVELFCSWQDRRIEKQR